MKYFEFENSVKIVYGDNALQELARIVLELGGRRALVISDKTLQKLGKTAQVIKLLNEKEITV
ncbi:MAG: iron-containing alcohol dehydrogenase, partial [Clostridia bacterium]